MARFDNDDLRRAVEQFEANLGPPPAWIVDRMRELYAGTPAQPRSDAEGEAVARELLRTTDLSAVPKYERIIIDDKTSIDVPIQSIDDSNMRDGDQVRVDINGDHTMIRELIVLRKKRLMR